MLFHGAIAGARRVVVEPTLEELKLRYFVTSAVAIRPAHTHSCTLSHLHIFLPVIQ